MKKIILLTLLTFACSVSSAGLLYNYPKLALMDLDQMNAMVKKKIAEYKKENSNQILLEAVQAVYSRPDNGDGMVEKVITPLRVELDENEQWELVIDTLVQEAVNAHKNPKAFTPVVLNTYAVFLENLIADYKPFAEKPGHERQTIQKIADADIELTKAQKDERWKRGLGKDRKSPSETAKDVIASAKKAEIETAKAQAAAQKAEADAASTDKKKKK